MGRKLETLLLAQDWNFLAFDDFHKQHYRAGDSAPPKKCNIFLGFSFPAETSLGQTPDLIKKDLDLVYPGLLPEMTGGELNFAFQRTFA